MVAPSPPDPDPRTEPDAGTRRDAGTVRDDRPHAGDTVRDDDDLPHRSQEIRVMAAMFGLLE